MNNSVSSTEKMKMLVKFLRSVFSYNCACFDTSCAVSGRGGGVLSPNVQHLVSHFRNLKNPLFCVTVLDSGERNYCGLISRYLQTFQNLGLLQIMKRVDKNFIRSKDSDLNLCAKLENDAICNYNTGDGCWKIFLTKHGKSYVPLEWTTLKSKHIGKDCFCAPIQALKADFGKATQWSDYTEQDLHDFTCVLFWYFRKAIVDTLMMQISSENPQMYCKALSVGSTKLDSDYDITVQGDCVNNMISKFQNYFVAIFGAESGDVFDTNLYGSSFSLIHRPTSDDIKPFLQHVNCSSTSYDPQNFWVVGPPLPSSRERTPDWVKLIDPYPQHTWALLKLYYSLVKVLHGPDNVEYKSIFASQLNGNKGSNIEQLLEILDTRLNDKNIAEILPARRGSHAQLAKKVMRMTGTVSSPLSSPDSPSRYDVSTFRDEKSYSKDLNFKLVASNYNDLVSKITMLNFMGSETYYTRGAFIDVVFNKQSCPKSPVAVPLDPDALLDSFIENFADWLSHPTKQKYVDRYKSALQSLLVFVTHPAWSEYKGNVFPVHIDSLLRKLLLHIQRWKGDIRSNEMVIEGVKCLVCGILDVWSRTGKMTTLEVIYDEMIANGL